MGFRSTIQLFQRVKTFHALDRAVFVIGSCVNYYSLIYIQEDCCASNSWTWTSIGDISLDDPEDSGVEYAGQNVPFYIVSEEMPRLKCLCTESSKYMPWLHKRCSFTPTENGSFISKWTLLTTKFLRKWRFNERQERVAYLVKDEYTMRTRCRPRCWKSVQMLTLHCFDYFWRELGLWCNHFRMAIPPA
jgi:hypothetical protein